MNEWTDGGVEFRIRCSLSFSPHLLSCLCVVNASGSNCQKYLKLIRVSLPLSLQVRFLPRVVRGLEEFGAAQFESQRVLPEGAKGAFLSLSILIVQICKQ